jgi:hypothetical protein
MYVGPNVGVIIVPPVMGTCSVCRPPAAPGLHRVNDSINEWYSLGRLCGCISSRAEIGWGSPGRVGVQKGACMSQQTNGSRRRTPGFIEYWFAAR